MRKPPPGTPLSDREMEIARLFAEGVTGKDIAAALWLSPSTVAAHMHRIHAKTGVRNKVELALWVAGHASAAEVPGD